MSVNLQEYEEAMIVAVLHPTETMAEFMRDAALKEARRRG